MTDPAAMAMRDSARVKAEAEARASWLVVVRSMFIGHPCSETSLALSFKSRNPGRIFTWLLFYHERLRLTTGPGPGLDPGVLMELLPGDSPVVRKYAVVRALIQKAPERISPWSLSPITRHFAGILQKLQREGLRKPSRKVRMT